MSEVTRWEAVHIRCGDSNIKYINGEGPQMVKASDYDALAAECERLLEDRDSHQRARIKALTELAALKGGREAVAWYTEDHLTDKSATTYDKDVAARWSNKGWLVVELFTTPHAQASAWVPEGLTAITRSMGRAIVRFKTTEQLNAFYRSMKSAIAAPTPGDSDVGL